jgi:hypothetical protein
VKIKVFTKGDCPVCRTDELGVLLRELEKWTSVLYYDIETAEGLVEAMFESVGDMKLPVFVFRNKEGIKQVIQGKVPSLNEILDQGEN